MKDEEYEEDMINNEELIPHVKELHDKCMRILEQCQQWNQESPIEDLHRYTNSVTSEMHFLEKVIHKYTHVHYNLPLLSS